MSGETGRINEYKPKIQKDPRLWYIMWLMKNHQREEHGKNPNSKRLGDAI
jgi:hypothetical protein